MRIMFRAVAMITGMSLLVGLIGLLLLNQVLALIPTCTSPVSAEEIAAYRAVWETMPDSAPHSAMPI